MLINTAGPRLFVSPDEGLGSLRFYSPTGGADDFAQFLTVPNGFGNGEFTHGFYARLDDVGQVPGTGVGNWWNGNQAPQTGGQNGWFRGNFLYDGHNNNNVSNGTFSFQVVNSGNSLRWTFGDGAAAAAKTWLMHACQGGSGLLDGEWHWIEVVRRFDGGSGSILELWIDNVLVDTDTSTARTAMYTTYWDDWAGYAQNGWMLGAEKISAGGGTEWEKYAGDQTEICFWTRAKTEAELESPDPADRFSSTNLVARFRMQEPVAGEITDTLASGVVIEMAPGANPQWVEERP